MQLSPLSGCNCGAVRFVANNPPQLVLNCHCNDCQQFAGALCTAAILYLKLT